MSKPLFHVYPSETEQGCVELRLTTEESQTIGALPLHEAEVSVTRASRKLRALRFGVTNSPAFALLDFARAMAPVVLRMGDGDRAVYMREIVKLRKSIVTPEGYAEAVGVDAEYREAMDDDHRR